MGATRLGAGPGGREASWANETLPLTVRRELLARELEKLGFGRPGAVAGGSGSDSAPRQQQQQQQQPQSQAGERPPRDPDAAPHGA